MKTIKLKLAIAMTAALAVASFSRMFAQNVLPEITVVAENYKYLSAVNREESAQPVDMLQQYAAQYDVKAAPFYDETYNNYVVSFYIPEGKILARYKDGQIQQTAERYEDVRLPKNITNAVAQKYPGWGISKDVYLVTYYQNQNASSRVYKLILDKGDQRVKTKIDDSGQFLK